MPSPHDRLFKNVCGDPQHAAEVIRRLCAPQVVAAFDLDSLERVDRSFVDEALTERHADLLFSLRLRGDDPPEALLYLLFEHQSTPDPMMPWRLHGYVSRIWAQWRKDHPEARHLPLVYPLVLYHGEAAWRAPLDLAELVRVPDAHREALAPALPHLRYDLIDLSGVADETLQEGALVALLLLLLKHHATGDLVGRLGRWREVVLRAVHQSGLRAIELAARYAMEVDPKPDNEARLLKLAADMLGEPGRETIMTTADRLRAEGWQVGRQEGRRDGAARLLKRALQVKFGGASEGQRARIDAADVDTLEGWMERVFTAERVEDVLGD